MSTLTTAAPSTRRRTALVAGLATLALAVTAFPANLVLLQFSASDDALAWVAANDLSLRLAVLAIVVAATLDVVIAWALTRFLERENTDLPRLAGWLRVTYSAAFLVAAGVLSTGIAAESDVAASAAIAGFSGVWSIALILFAAHLLVLGAVLLRTPEVPRAFGILIVLAGAAYAADGVARILIADLGALDAVLTGAVAVTSIVGEVGFAIWLLARGGRR